MAQYIFFDLDGTLTIPVPVSSIPFSTPWSDGRPEPDVEKVRRTFIGRP